MFQAEKVLRKVFHPHSNIIFLILASASVTPLFFTISRISFSARRRSTFLRFALFLISDIAILRILVSKFRYSSYSEPKTSSNFSLILLATAGLAPPVEILIQRSPLFIVEGTIKEQSSG